MNIVVTDSRHDWVKRNHISHQSCHGGDRIIGISESYLNHDGEGRTGFREKSVAVNGNSSKIHVAFRGKSSPLKTKPIVLCTIRILNSCENV